MSGQLAIDFAQTVEAIFYARTDAQRAAAQLLGLPNAATPVLVISNGSGVVHDLDALFETLARRTLSPRFRSYGNFRLVSERRPEVIEFFGNFNDVSHVFSVRCLASSATARRLNEAIEANLATPAYAAACVEDEERHRAELARLKSAVARRRP